MVCVFFLCGCTTCTGYCINVAEAKRPLWTQSRAMFESGHCSIAALSALSVRLFLSLGMSRACKSVTLRATDDDDRLCGFDTISSRVSASSLYIFVHECTVAPLECVCPSTLEWIVNESEIQLRHRCWCTLRNGPNGFQWSKWLWLQRFHDGRAQRARQLDRQVSSRTEHPIPPHTLYVKML